MASVALMMSKNPDIKRIAIPRVREQRSSPSQPDGDRRSSGKHRAMPARSRLRLSDFPVHSSTEQQLLPARHRSCDGGEPLNWYRYAAEQAPASQRQDQPASRHWEEEYADTQ